MVTGSLKRHKIKKKQLKIQENRTFNGKNIRFCDYFQDSASRTGSPANTCVRFTKTSKTPLMMSVAFGPTSCSSGLVPKSMLLHRPESHDGFVPKHSHHGGKNHALRAKRQDYRYPNIVDGLENVHVAP